MRLIDADAFIQRLFDYAITDSDIEFCEKVKFALESEPILNDGWIPVTEGLPKIIQCKDCKYMTEDYYTDGNAPYWICSEWDSGTDYDGFCHYAERRIDE